MADEQSKPTPSPRGGGQSDEQKATEAQRASNPTQKAAGEGKAGEDRSAAERDRGVRTGVRTGGTTEAMAAEFDALGVDARLDNRVGDQRPQRSPFLKPQQVDGPEVGHFAEHAEAHAEEYAELTGVDAVQGDAVGMRSEGDLGRGPDVGPAGVED